MHKLKHKEHMQANIHK